MRLPKRWTRRPESKKKSMRKKDASPYPSSSHLLGHDRVHHGCARRVSVHAIRGARWPGDIVDSSNGIPHHLRRSWVEIVERANLDQLDGLLDLQEVLFGISQTNTSEKISRQ